MKGHLALGIFSRIAEQKINEAVQNGELDNLAYAGKKLNLEDLSHIPEDLRMSYRILKNAGFVPEEVTLKNECVRLFDLIQACGNDGEREQHRKVLNEKTLRLQLLLEQRGISSTSAFLQYDQQIKDRLT